MKNVLILYWESGRKKFKFDDKKYQKSYEVLTAIAKQRNIDIIFSDINFWDRRKGAFTRHTFFNGYKWVQKKERRGIIPDLVFDKVGTNQKNAVQKRSIEQKLRIVNPLIFQELLRNKYLNYFIFEDFYPRSFFIANKRELKKKIRDIRTKKFVLKPVSGTGGDRVEILQTKGNNRRINIDGLYILQEFIDSSRGIRGITRGIHDLRVTIVGKRISYAYARVPKRGGLICNISRGGRMLPVENNQIPESVKKICKIVMKKFSPFGNLVYAIDFAIDRDRKAKIIEMNSMPGLYFDPWDKKKQRKYYNDLLDNFLKSAN